MVFPPGFQSRLTPSGASAVDTRTAFPPCSGPLLHERSGAILGCLGKGRAACKAVPALAFAFLFLSAFAFGQKDTVATYHFDATRSGQMTDETILVPSNVNYTRFGKLFSYPVDG